MGPFPATTVHRRLLPGLRPVVREPGVLQVGLDAPRRALLADHPDVRRLLAALGAARPARVTTATAATALADLDRAGLLVDASAPDAPVAPVLLARHGPAAADVAASRAAHRVLVDAPPAVQTLARPLLVAAGAGLADDPAGATLVLVAALGQVSRERTDPWVRDGVPHLVLTTHDGGMTLGPFVVPGATACLRCVDAHRGEHDPRRPMLLEQLAREATPVPHDEVVLTLAVAWAVRDLLLHARGERPTTWSATVDVDTTGSGADLEPLTWTRHPHCGCAWDAWPARLRSVDD